MSAKDLLSNFIDSVVSGDAAAQKLNFSQYCEYKARDVLGVQQATTAAVEVPALSEQQILVLERDMGDDIDLEGNDVLVKGKKVARLVYKGEEENAQLYLVTNDGSSMPIKNNDIEDLMRVIRHKFLGEA